jgi:hypothetical protein
VGVKLWLGYSYRGEVSEDEAWRMAAGFMRPMAGCSIRDALGGMIRMNFEDGSALNLSIDEDVQPATGWVERYLHASTASYTDSQAKEYMAQLVKSFEEIGVRHREYIRQVVAPNPLLHRVWKLSREAK